MKPYFIFIASVLPRSAGDFNVVTPAFSSAANFAAGRALAAGNDRALMAHALACRRRSTRDEGDDRLLHVFLDELGRLFLGAAADFADHDDAFGLRVVLEQPEAVDEAEGR